MKQFTYYDYLKYKRIENIILKKTIGLSEEPEEYKYIKNSKNGNKEINNKHDKIFRMGLDNSKEVAKFINEKMDLELKLERRIFRKI